MAEDTPDLVALLEIRDAAGPNALTPEEQQFIDSLAPKRTTPTEHFADLTPAFDDVYLNNLAQDIIRWVGWDEDAREEWREMEAMGIRALGVSPNVDGGANFTGASRAVHPVLAEACVQFASRAMANIWPAGGPVKTGVMGDITEERLQQATRVGRFMNYQYTNLMPGAYEQTDQMMHRLPLSGSCFVKVFPDYRERVTRRFVEPVDMIVPYKATDLKTAPRFTERVPTTKNQLRKLQVAGYYRDIPLQLPLQDHDDDRSTVTDEIEATEGQSDHQIYAEDEKHTLYECYCELDLEGFEDEKDGKPTGISLPYIVTVEKDSQRVLAIRRNWRENDEEKERIIYHTHYRFTPGLGFYGYGLYHWIGSLSRAATGALRALLDAGLLANLQGGYRTRLSTIDGGDETFTPGQFKEVDVSGEDLNKAFYNLPFKEPSATLFALMGHLEDLSRRFAGTTDVLVGEGNSNVPVGTTLARIEQGSKVTSAVQNRIHKAAAEEFKLVAWLDSIFLPQEYPYEVQGESREVFRQDFDSRVDVVPVSDPNFVSNTQKYFTSEVSLDIAARNPDLYDMRALHRRAQASLGIEDLDEILPDPEKNVHRMGPIEENAAALTGLPFKAFPEQHHEAHVELHMRFVESLDKKQMETAGVLMEAHIQEHLAQAYLLSMQQMTGAPFQQPTPNPELWRPVSIEEENQIAVLAAQAMLQAERAQPQIPDPMVEDQRRRDEQAQADIQRKDTVALADIQRDNAEMEADINRKATEAMNEVILEQQQQQNTPPAGQQND